MRTTIDRAGRIVVPKAIRERLRLLAGGEVDIVERDGVIEIVAAPASVELTETAEGLVATPIDSLPPLTDDELFSAIDRTRR
ncbi:MAG: AbrB/MazE/SpoVT family DNA-binding domain-containing protein [Acidimicrobiales bacterium]